MRISYGPSSDGKRKMWLEVDSEELTEIEKEIFQKNKRHLKVPGFRPGHVPFSIAKARYKDFLFDEAVRVFSESGINRLQEGKLSFRPNLEKDFTVLNANVDENGNANIIVDYFGLVTSEITDLPLAIDHTLFDTEVTDDDVENELEQQVLDNIIYEESDDDLSAGDRITYDYHSYIDHDDHTELVKSFVDRQEIVDDDFISQHDFSRKGEYTTEEDGIISYYNIKRIEKGRRLELDDDFVKSILSTEGSQEMSLEEYKNSIREMLEKEKELHNKQVLINDIFKHLLENSSCDIEESYFESYLDEATEADNFTREVLQNEKAFLPDVEVYSAEVVKEELEPYILYQSIIEDMNFKISPKEGSPLDYFEIIEDRAALEELLEIYNYSTEDTAPDANMVNELYAISLLEGAIYNRLKTAHDAGLDTITYSELTRSRR